MTSPFAGVRVVEVASYLFVPVGGAILADLGADVIKVETPTGDPLRGLRTHTLEVDQSGDGPNPFDDSSVLFEIANRGKRSIRLDLRQEHGRAALDRLIATADVFITNYLPDVRRRLDIDVEALRSVNSDLIYVRGSGWGPRGPMRDQSAFDMAAGWAASGCAYQMTAGNEPEPMPHAFFDVPGGTTLAGAVGAALYHRERTGEASVVDVSLLNVGWWTMAPSIVAAPYNDRITPPREAPSNPLVNWYRTADDRWIYLVLTQADRFWEELCLAIERPDLVSDARFADAPLRSANVGECVRELDVIFASRTLAQWQSALSGFSGVWSPSLSPREIHQHPQAAPNDYLPSVTATNDATFRLVATPMQFGEAPTRPRGPAPQPGQHSEEILLEMGMTWDDIAVMHTHGALG
jgi:formyl-CoA transferase